MTVGSYRLPKRQSFGWPDYGVAAICLVLSATVAAPALAQSASMAPAPVPAQPTYEELFQASLANPADLDAAFRYAEAATAAGDYEAAIGALERMLFFNPSLARVRLELGVLYFRLGAYAQARAYLESAIAQPDTPPDVRQRVELVVAEINRREKPSRFSGFVQTGVRSQSNANAGPSNLNVRAGGTNAPLDPRFGADADWNAFVLGGVRHVYDMGSQYGHAWESTADLYFGRQFEIRRLDVDLGELTTGPRLGLGLDNIPGASIRPYALLGTLRLGDTPYMTSYGAGLSASVPRPFGGLEVGVEFRERRFNDSSLYPVAEQQTGNLTSAYLAYTHPFSPSLRLQGRAAVGVNAADEAFNSYSQSGLSFALIWEFASPIQSVPYRWTVSPSAGVTWTGFDDPDPVIDPSVRRRDYEYRAGIGLDAPITDSLGMGVQFRYMRNSSNLPNFRYHNYSVMFGPTYRF